ncbi:hypothetical protein GE061_016473 [Apolygus lucorum]|uniref:Peptidase M14 domain-containing protein n=1 Tax=Apolygus lucorum TaxID=248454 RepID=A0A8S9XHJ5_APOLU|nr:hypothetical protein GE061_016473 [Apolygus lucorum]
MALNNKKEKRGSNNGKRSNKRKPVKKRKYSPRKLQQALEEVEKGTLSARKAAEKFGVPRSTVGFRFSPKFMKTQFGTPTVLTSEEESTLVNNFFETSFQNEVRKPAAGSSNEGLIVIEVPAVVGKTIEVGEPCVSTEDVIMMDPSDESTGVITSKNLKLHSSILMDASPEEESEKKDASSDEESREKKDDSPKEESGKKKSLDPIVLKKTKHGPIEEWLVWPKTPEKKGKRIQKMMPYVITSESWKAEKKEEIERKEEARKAKEERTLKKSKNTKPPAKKNVSKKLTIKNGQGKESKKKGPQRQLFAQNHAHSSKAYQYSVEEHVDEEEVELRSDSEEGHMRIDGPEEPLDDLIINDNNDFIRGMCFTCTRSLNATNPGRSCDVCEKLFHNNCEYLSEDGQLTICQSCSTIPDLVKIVTIGKSSENRPLKVAHISSGKRKDAPAIWIDGGIHGREWVAPSTALFILKQLTENYNTNKAVVDGIDWFIMPVANPDGYEYSHSVDRFWRKNRSKNPAKRYEDYYDEARYGRECADDAETCQGVDLNRNWDFHWKEIGASSSPCKPTFAGDRPFSEPETRAMSDFIMDRSDRLVELEEL